MKSGLDSELTTIVRFNHCNTENSYLTKQRGFSRECFFVVVVNEMINENPLTMNVCDGIKFCIYRIYAIVCFHFLVYFFFFFELILFYPIEEYISLFFAVACMLMCLGYLI